VSLLLDLLFVAIIVAFFTAMVGLTHACQWIIAERRGDDEETAEPTGWDDPDADVELEELPLNRHQPK